MPIEENAKCRMQNAEGLLTVVWEFGAALFNQECVPNGGDLAFDGLEHPGGFAGVAFGFSHFAPEEESQRIAFRQLVLALDVLPFFP